ncbi:MAG: hypothetical protein IKZ30_01385 [Oscillospiraceae bacterium]|nr:hypothetical protein [Oscillospiraceae bacterium]
MELTSPEKARLKLELMAEAEKLACSLCSFMQQTVPILHEGDDEDIMCFTEHFSSAIDRLRDLNAQVDELNAADQISPETESNCERLRKSIRCELEKVDVLSADARKVIERRRDIYQHSLIEARKKQNLSAYLQSSFAGQDPFSYNRHK